VPVSEDGGAVHAKEEKSQGMQGSEVHEVFLGIEIEAGNGAISCFVRCLPGKREVANAVGGHPTSQQLVYFVEECGCFASSWRSEISKHL
jgi:hypothetical protein